MKIVQPGHELMVVSEEGVVIRIEATDVSQQGRATQGVRVMNVSDSDRVCAVARVATTAKKPPTGVSALSLDSMELDLDGDEGEDELEYEGDEGEGDAATDGRLFGASADEGGEDAGQGGGF